MCFIFSCALISSIFSASSVTLSFIAFATILFTFLLLCTYSALDSTSLFFSRSYVSLFSQRFFHIAIPPPRFFSITTSGCTTYLLYRFSHFLNDHIPIIIFADHLSIFSSNAFWTFSCFNFHNFTLFVLTACTV